MSRITSLAGRAPWGAALPLGLAGLAGIRAYAGDHGALTYTASFGWSWCFVNALRAISVWSVPSAAQGLARRNPRLRSLAGAAQAFGRPLLALALPALVAWSGLRLWPSSSYDTRVFMVLCWVLPAVSSAFALWVAPLFISEWREFGGVVVVLETPSARPGDEARAVVYIGRQCETLSATLRHHASSAPDTEEGPAARGVRAAVVESLPQDDGSWRITLAARVPKDAAPTKEEVEGEDSWSFWSFVVNLSWPGREHHLASLDLRVDAA